MPEKLPQDILVKLYASMYLIRQVQLKIEAEYPYDEMRTPVHLCIGQEAVPAGVCLNLKKTDYVFGNHRGHGHYLAKGGNLKKLISELYCKEAGCSKGRGGSMHLVDVSTGLMGSSAIVGGNIPIAVGAALTSSLKKDGRVSVVFFGDGATEEGVLYESMNFAALKNLPVIFVCENNHYSVYSHINNRQPKDSILKRAKAFMPATSAAGNDVSDVYLKARAAVKSARAGKGPSFLECKVYRWRDHAGAGDPLKLKYRDLTEAAKWMKRCPLISLEDKIALKTLEKIQRKTAMEIEAAFKSAKAAPLPDKKELLNYLYADTED